jgi:hypothetical protein
LNALCDVVRFETCNIYARQFDFSHNAFDMPFRRLVSSQYHLHGLKAHERNLSQSMRTEKTHELMPMKRSRASRQRGGLANGYWRSVPHPPSGYLHPYRLPVIYNPTMRLGPQGHRSSRLSNHHGKVKQFFYMSVKQLFYELFRATVRVSAHREDHPCDSHGRNVSSRQAALPNIGVYEIPYIPMARDTTFSGIGRAQ